MPYFLPGPVSTIKWICERQGDRAKAIEYYGKFVELWKNTDRVRPKLEDARNRLPLR